MGFRFQAVVPIKAVSVAASFATCRTAVYNFSDTCVATEKCRDLDSQVDQEVRGWRFVRGGNAGEADRDWRVGLTDGRQHFVGYKTALSKRPEQYIERLRHSGIAGMGVDPVPQLVSLLRQPAGESKAGGGFGPAQHITGYSRCTH